jgi:hypothetical protein
VLLSILVSCLQQGFSDSLKKKYQRLHPKSTITQLK